MFYFACFYLHGHINPKRLVASQPATLAAADMDTIPPASGVTSILPAMKEVEDLRTKPAWTDFVKDVRAAIKGGVRQALAQHTTTACQPKKAQGVAGPSGSLKSSGADDPHETDGMHECHIALANLLEPGDGRALDYVSEGKRSKKQAQEAACVELLSYILFRGPRHLRTHANQWHADQLEAVRDFTEHDLREQLGPRPRGQWSPLSWALDAPETRQPTGLGVSGSAYMAPADDEDLAERDARILRALRLVRRNQDNEGPLPRNVFPVLDRELPQGGQENVDEQHWRCP